MRPSLSRLRALVAAKARRDGADGRPRPLTPATGEALREELLFGRPGPMFGTGPAKAQLLADFIDHTQTRESVSALGAEGRAHYAEQTGTVPPVGVAELRERVAAFYAPVSRAREDVPQ